MLEDNQGQNSDKAEPSNWPMIILLLFVMLPATVIFITEITTDKIIYRTVLETFPSLKR